jgi:hypothetical protein
MYLAAHMVFWDLCGFLSDQYGPCWTAMLMRLCYDKVHDMVPLE